MTQGDLEFLRHQCDGCCGKGPDSISAAAAAVAAAWVMACNARCQLSAGAVDIGGSPLAMLCGHGSGYLSLRW